MWLYVVVGNRVISLNVVVVHAVSAPSVRSARATCSCCYDTCVCVCVCVCECVCECVCMCTLNFGTRVDVIHEASGKFIRVITS